MYQSYWQLEQRPFENVADPRFYYPGEAHQGALLKLRYAVENRQAAVLLAGAPGIGKTLLVRTLLERLPESFSPRVHLVFPQMPPDQLLAYIAGELDGRPLTKTPPTVQQSVQRISKFLAANASEGRHAVVVVDEAQHLAETGALELMRLLLNFEASGGQALTLLLVGQPAILPAMDRLPALEERLGVKCLMRPLSADETASYVEHRLTAAGAKQPIFQPEALDAIHQLTHGIPRRINRLADLALLVGFAEERSMISAADVEAVSHELVTVTPE